MFGSDSGWPSWSLAPYAADSAAFRDPPKLGLDVSSASDRASNTDKMEAMHTELEALKECQRKSEQRILKLTGAQENTDCQLRQERCARKVTLETARISQKTEVDELKDDIDRVGYDAAEATDEVGKLREAAAIGRAVYGTSLTGLLTREIIECILSFLSPQRSESLIDYLSNVFDGKRVCYELPRAMVRVCCLCNKGEQGQWCERYMCRPCCMKAYADEDFCRRCPQHQPSEPSSWSSSGWSSGSPSGGSSRKLGGC